RAQRNTVALRDVDYLVRAEFSLTDMAGPEDNIPKFVEMFERRVRKGQHFQQPYFGCREFAAEILTPEDAPGAIQGLTKPLGVMLWDIEFGSVNMPLFFDARLVNGVMSVPECPIRLVRSGGEA
ncbi:MAG: type I-E CRISPR-associated protein Cas5/CasD, partial [Candidatus Brocadiia bacterium]